MADVVTFPFIAPRTGRKKQTAVRADGDTKHNVVVFTGVWHERVNNPKRQKNTGKPVGRRK